MDNLIFILVLIFLGYAVGSFREKKHYDSIHLREDEFADIMIFDIKHIPDTDNSSHGDLVNGGVVISVDYFKRFVAGLRLLFGGRLRSYETLLDRGRREAVLRMKQEAKTLGANRIFNVKYETTSISKGAKSSLGSVEVYVYGSAINNNSI